MAAFVFCTWAGGRRVSMGEEIVCGGRHNLCLFTLYGRPLPFMSSPPVLLFYSCLPNCANVMLLKCNKVDCCTFIGDVLLLKLSFLDPRPSFRFFSGFLMRRKRKYFPVSDNIWTFENVPNTHGQIFPFCSAAVLRVLYAK